MYKVSGATRAETASCTGWPGSVEADGNYVVERNTRPVGGDLKTIRDLLEADLWPLLRKCRMLAQPLDKKPFLPVH
jgi:hypothetical protein